MIIRLLNAPLHALVKLSFACLILLGFPGQHASFARSADAPHPLADLNVAAYIKEAGGGYTDLFRKLKKHNAFNYLCARHRLDDPAVWPKLRQKFIVKLNDSTKELSDAKALMATEDARSGLDGRIISAENTRARGRALSEKLSAEIAEIEQALRIMDELIEALELVEAEHALSETITLSSVNAQSFSGQVLLVDSTDLIVKHAGGGYYRIAAQMLSESTKLSLLDSIFSRWGALPHLLHDEQSAEKNAGELVAYSDELLYINDRFEGLVSEDRAKSQFAFQPYEAQIEELKEEGARNADKTTSLKDYEEAVALNNMRVKAIAWYEARLGTELIKSQREKAYAYHEELSRHEEAEAAQFESDNDGDNDGDPKPESLGEVDSESEVQVESEASAKPL